MKDLFNKSLKSLISCSCAVMILLSCDTNYETLKVTYCRPGGNETGILPDSTVEIGFSASVNRTDVEDNFSLRNGDGTVSGSFTWPSDSSFIYTPTVPMSKNGRYAIGLTRSIRDSDGNTMDSDFISEFYVGSDFTTPFITSSIPESSPGALTSVPVNQSIVLNFTKSMNRESVEKNFSISPNVSGYFVWSECTAGLSHSRLEYVLLAEMEYGKLYTFTVSQSAEDSAGNRMNRDYRVNFITGNDFTPPSIEKIYDFSDPSSEWDPAQLNNGISKNVTIGMEFTEAMDRQSVERAFSIIPQVQGNFIWNGDSVEFKPSRNLNPETRYQISVDTSAKNINGLKLSSKYTVEIITDNPDSLYVKPGAVRGSNHDGDFIDLPSAWPRIIDMGGDPANTSYYLEIGFFSDSTLSDPAEMTKYSIYDNLLIETFKSAADSSGLHDSARIGNVEWVSGNTARIRIDGMTNKGTQVPALYRLTVAGGENGVTDTKKNYMENDFVIEFREAIP